MNTLSFNETAHLLTQIDNTISVIVEGETGIGKSSLASVVAKQREAKTGKQHTLFVLDCTVADVGDVMLPMPMQVRGIQQVQYAPNACFGFGEDHPVIILLDELGKASKPVKDALLPLLLEHRVGGYTLPEGSMVIATSNLMDEGLGDVFEAHANNRVILVEMRKPSAAEWMEYAIPAGCAGEVLAFVRQFPTVFQSFRDSGARENTYIHDPRHPERRSFVTPRSLMRLSTLLSARKNLPTPTMLAAMTGCVGEAAARDMTTMLTLADALPSLESVMSNPMTAMVSDKPIAQLILGINLVRAATIATGVAVVEYITRLESEVQAVLAYQMASDVANIAKFTTAPAFIQLTSRVNKLAS